MMRRLLLTFFVMAVVSGLFTADLWSGEKVITVIVKEGDTLSIIANKYLNDPAKWKELLRVNHIKNPNLIYPGQKLIIPITMASKQLIESSYATSATVGVITFVRGKAYKEVNIVATPNMSLLNGDVLVTGNNGFINIMFRDGNILSVYPDSKFRITEVVPRKKSRFMLFWGKVISKVKKLLKKSIFRIETPVAIGGVRGTEFRMAYKNDVSRVEVLRGAVYMEAAGKEVVVPAGYGSLAEKGKPPIEPVRLPPPPRLLYPKDGARIKKFQFAWKGKGDRYIFEVALDRDFSKIYFVREVTGESFYPELVTVGIGEYYWRVSAVRNGFQGLPSGIRQFVVSE